MESEKRIYRMDRGEIGFVRFVLEAYEGIATMTTLDPKTGLVEFHIPPGQEADFETLLDDLKKNILMEPATRDT